MKLRSSERFFWPSLGFELRRGENTVPKLEELPEAVQRRLRGYIDSGVVRVLDDGDDGDELASGVQDIVEAEGDGRVARIDDLGSVEPMPLPAAADATSDRRRSRYRRRVGMNPFEPPKPAAEKLAARADFKLVPYDRFKYLTDLAPDQVLRRLEGVSRLVRGAGSSGADPKGAPNQPDALEILNAGGAPVNLSMRRVLVYQDGSGTADATSVSRSSPTKIERRSFRASFTSC